MSISSEYKNIVNNLYDLNSNPKLGLERMRELIKKIKYAKNKIIIQIIGTNGKGSTAAFLESILHEHDYSVGLFTSPHLCSISERIRVNKQDISPQEFIHNTKKILEISQKFNIKASFFEHILAIALKIFSQYNLDIIILEAGLGGRLDATTALSRDIIGVTQLGLDHQHILGENISEIIYEKLAAAPKNTSIIISEQNKNLIKKINIVINKLEINYSWANKNNNLKLGLLGEFQKFNSGVALKILEKLKIKLCKKKIILGLKNTKWPGRLEVINYQDTKIIFDGAHNPDGIKNLVNNLEKISKEFILLYGSVKSLNNFEKINNLIKSNIKFEHIYLHTAQNPRALEYLDLKNIFLKIMTKNKIAKFDNILKIMKKSREYNIPILVCGSLYTVGAIRGEILDVASDTRTANF